MVWFSNKEKSIIDKIIELAKRSKSGGSSVEYPKRIKTRAQRALYDNLGEDEELASMLDERIKEVNSSIGFDSILIY